MNNFEELVAAIRYFIEEQVRLENNQAAKNMREKAAQLIPQDYAWGKVLAAKIRALSL